MNPFLERLEPYPFERLNDLKASLVTRSTQDHVALSIGEPKHDAPDFVVAALTDDMAIRKSLGSYPPTRGALSLRETIGLWIARRFGVTLDPEREILPVSGTREALFSFGQAVLSGRRDARVMIPNPFYQIYEGATLLRGAEPYFVPASGIPDFSGVPDDVWDATELVYLCSPGNPTGFATPREILVDLIERAHRHDFVIASDECYSEVYYDEANPPLGLLTAANDAGFGVDRLVVFNSLSKRSNLPGLRSGFAAGDPNLIESYFEYRTYHGCAQPTLVSTVSELAWSDEDHVITNRAIYRAKFDAIQPIIERGFDDVIIPDGGFYYWPKTPIDDQAYTAKLFEEENITVLPGSFLAREFHGENPGANRVRVALVAPLEQCVAAIERLVEFNGRLS